ncbi:MAG: PKD domain-containing protein, partial [Methanomethylovorans sp.]|uniref:PKD domain-containing protein n=2 Tax=Methanomethylovorans sp. TaxID=2758717 RepID=UPI003C780228
MKKIVLILATMFILYLGCVGSAEQLLKGNSIHEDGQVTCVRTGTIEDGPENTLQTLDKKLSSKANSSTSGFSSETYISATSASAKNSKAPVTNVAPIAIIDSITPNPAPKGSSVTFRGSGTDKDGTIKAYLWTIDGNIVSTKAGFSTSHIAVGTHSITFRVQDNAKKWS